MNKEERIALNALSDSYLKKFKKKQTAKGIVDEEPINVVEDTKKSKIVKVFSKDRYREGI
jgi:hypothetical protein